MALNADKNRPVPAAPGSKARDDGRYVDHSLLESLESFVARMKRYDGPSSCDPVDLRRIEDFLYQEARLLDARRYQDWFELLSDDFAYWIPSTYGDPSLHRDVAINFDDRRRILDRIAYTESGVQIAQTPPSRTMRSLANVRAWRREPPRTGRDAPESNGFDVAASLTIWAHRRGVTQCFVGHLSMMLQPRGSSFAISARVIELLDADEPQGNNSFIL